MKSLGTVIASEGRKNNLNTIRLLLALLVIFSHSFPLSLSSINNLFEPKFLFGLMTLGYFAVNIFFAISGFLITASWLNSKSANDYLMKRILRIYPAFICALILSAIILWVSCPVFRDNVGHGFSWFSYFISNCITLENSSINKTPWEGVFAGNPLPNYTNGSLWTIPIEFHCYLIVLLLGTVSIFKKRGLILIITIYSLSSYGFSWLHGDDSNTYLNRFLAFFLAGMCFWLWRDKIPFSKWIASASLLILFISSYLNPWFAILLPIFGLYLLLWIGYGPKIPFTEWTQKTDLSYGVYLYAYPVQQLIAMQKPLREPWINITIATPIVLVLAYLSWHYVEKRFLAMKSRHGVDYDPGTGDEALKSCSKA